jgi:hypothetical protein
MARAGGAFYRAEGVGGDRSTEELDDQRWWTLMALVMEGEGDGTMP